MGTCRRRSARHAPRLDSGWSWLTKRSSARKTCQRWKRARSAAARSGGEISCTTDPPLSAMVKAPRWVMATSAASISASHARLPSAMLSSTISRTRTPLAASSAPSTSLLADARGGADTWSESEALANCASKPAVPYVGIAAADGGTCSPRCNALSAESKRISAHTRSSGSSRKLIEARTGLDSLRERRNASDCEPDSCALASKLVPLALGRPPDSWKGTPRARVSNRPSGSPA
mmetsp:Transcript_3728/g.8030  ORF Transcript_3728/g.8030 Transcript_3728/m.8030 type:complete len:234 (+) Transcript_3728:364-1065(+)